MKQFYIGQAKIHVHAGVKAIDIIMQLRMMMGPQLNHSKC